MGVGVSGGRVRFWRGHPATEEGKRRIIAVKVPLEGFQQHSSVRRGKKKDNCR